MKHKTFIGASLLAAIAASLCCILPIVFALGGFAIVGASAFFESLRPYFLIVTFALLGVGFYLSYRKPKQVCEPGSACARPPVNHLGRAACGLLRRSWSLSRHSPTTREHWPISCCRTTALTLHPSGRQIPFSA